MIDFLFSYTFFCFVLTFLSSYLIIKYLRKIAFKISLIDRPCQRKDHQGEIPVIGGIGVFLSTILGSFLIIDNLDLFYFYAFSSFLLIILGVLDDRHDISAKIKLLGQFLLATITIFIADNRILELGNLFGQGDIVLSYWTSIFISYLAIIGAMNAFNMIDGLDGLLGSISIVILISLAGLFYKNLNYNLALLSLLLVTSIAPYLFYNLRKKRKIFMGDSGSMFIGYSIVWLMFLGSQKNSNFNLNQTAFEPVYALWIIAYPLCDMASVMLNRIISAKSPFQADRNHLHHVFLDSRLKKKVILITLTFITAINQWFPYVFAREIKTQSAAFLLFILFFIAIFFIKQFALQKKCV